MRALAIFLVAAGCEGVVPAVDWQQMIDQHKAQPFEASAFFPDGRAMQTPPEGTVPRDRVVDQPALTDGIVGGKYVAGLPVPLSRELVATGRARFDTFCAACHGLDGSGQSEVARSMERRKPPSLLEPPVTQFPPGRIFQVVTQGYGLMPRYSYALTVRERWAVVAYLRALQLSGGVELARLPPEERAAARAALPEAKP